MKCRTNKKTGDKVSEIGLGTAYMFDDVADGVEALRRAREGGISLFDLGAGHSNTFPLYGEALADVRHDVFYQIQFGAETEGKGFSNSLHRKDHLPTFRMTVTQTGDYVPRVAFSCAEGELLS